MFGALGCWLVLGGWVGGCVGLGLCRVLCCVRVLCLLCTCLFSSDSLVIVCVDCVWFVSILNFILVSVFSVVVKWCWCALVSVLLT